MTDPHESIAMLPMMGGENEKVIVHLCCLEIVFNLFSLSLTNSFFFYSHESECGFSIDPLHIIPFIASENHLWSTSE